jgi:hypothetical protein
MGQHARLSRDGITQADVVEHPQQRRGPGNAVLRRIDADHRIAAAK